MRAWSIAFIAVSLSGCFIGIPGSGDPATETFDINAPVESFVVTNFVDVEIRVGEPGSGELTCDDNLLQYLETPFNEGELRLRTQPGVNLNPLVDCQLLLTIPSVEGIGVTGSGSIRSSDPLSTLINARSSSSGDIELTEAGGDTFTASVSGSGSIQVTSVLSPFEVVAETSSSGSVELGAIQADAVTAELSGSGDIELVGSTDLLAARLRSSGDLDASALDAIDVDVRVSGSGSADVQASGAVSGSLSGSGDLIVRGDPTIEVSTSGSGDVVRR